MKVTFKGIAANVVTVKFTLACKCHVLVDLKKNANFWKKLRFAKNSIQVLAGCFLFQISYIHNLPGNIKNGNYIFVPWALEVQVIVYIWVGTKTKSYHHLLVLTYTSYYRSRIFYTMERHSVTSQLRSTYSAHHAQHIVVKRMHILVDISVPY